MNHFTAWLTTAPDCLTGDTADVVVLADEAVGERTYDGGTTITEWTSVGSPVFHADTGIHHTADIQQIADRAQDILADGGWELTGERWDTVPTGLVIEVTRDLRNGDRVIADATAVRVGMQTSGTVQETRDGGVLVIFDDGRYRIVAPEKLTYVPS